MTSSELLRYRRYNQHIIAHRQETPGDLVSYLGAVQAQDYNAAKWALGLRLQNRSDADIEQAFNNGEIIRTHVLRPTWHFVAPADIRWMLQLTAPRIRMLSRYQYRQLELDDKLFVKSNKIIGKALLAEAHLLRSDLISVLDKAKIPTNEQRFIHIMMRAELDGLVCSGPRIGKQFSYALLDKRVPATPSITDQEALAKLALKYFTGHGPASLADFAWWSGLTVTDAKEALALIKEVLVEVNSDGKTYWMPKDAESVLPSNADVHILPAYDEYLISYADRGAALGPKHFRTVATSNGIFNPVLVINGKVAGTWKRNINKGKVDIEIRAFDKISASAAVRLNAATRRYKKFLGMN